MQCSARLGGAEQPRPSPDLVLGNMLQIVMMEEKPIHRLTLCAGHRASCPPVHLTVDNGVFAELNADNWSTLSIISHGRIL